MSDDTTEGTEGTEGTEAPEYQFDFYFLADVDGGAAIVTVNFGLEAWAPIEGCDHLLVVSIELTDAGEHGLGSEAEAEALAGIEEKLQAAFAEAGAWSVGRLRNNGNWQVFAYGAESVDVEAIAAGLLTDDPHNYGVVKQPDAEWGYYNTFLLPDDERRQWISNRAGVEALAENGAALDEKRRIDHWTHFAAADKREAFVAAAGAEGFEVHELSETDDDGTTWFWAQVHRSDTAELAELHKTVMSLVEFAEAQEGGYDGWEAATDA